MPPGRDRLPTRQPARPARRLTVGWDALDALEVAAALLVAATATRAVTAWPGSQVEVGSLGWWSDCMTMLVQAASGDPKWTKTL